MNAKKWNEHNWGGPLETLGIRHRKFYATRHTFITEAIKRGENPLAVAQYCGTSLAMIEADYCGTLGLRLDQIVFRTASRKSLEKYGCGAGI
jgi:integrase